MGDVAIAGILVGVAILISMRHKLGLEKELVAATGRALVQLLALAALIQLVFAVLALSGLILFVMLVAASWTCGRRLRGVPRASRLAAIAISAGSCMALIVLFGSGVFPLAPRYVIPIAGMLIGNSMTATSVAGMRVRDELLDKRLEVEARLALGVPARAALRGYLAKATRLALVPTVDTTKNVGLIMLPGAFVGMILGGASPLDAAQVQLIVLFMLLGAVSLAGIVATLLVARAFVGSGERLVLPSPPGAPATG